LEVARINLNDDVQRDRLTRLSKSIDFFDVSSSSLPQGVSLPDKDAPIVLAAIEAKATHLITGDIRHLDCIWQENTGHSRLAARRLYEEDLGMTTALDAALPCCYRPRLPNAAVALRELDIDSPGDSVCCS
jgi:hypothetical protein